MTVGNRVHLSKADITDLEEEFVLRAIRSGWVAPLGPDVDSFESEVAQRVGVRHAVALSSGTAALHLALLGLGVGPGGVVVLPTLTFAASANAVLYTGAEPVFVDALADDGNVDPALLVGAVDALRHEGKDIQAVMTVDLFGRACDYDEILPELTARGVPLLEDAAESLGATYRGRGAGSFGQAAALSFNGNKILTTSGGGMLLSNDGELADRARSRATQSREPVPWYEHTEVGYNYRLSNLLAALGRAQLTRLDEMIERRKQIREHYIKTIGDTFPVRFLGRAKDRGDSRDNNWLTTLVVEDDSIVVDDFIQSMNSSGVEVRHLWKPMHLQPLFADARQFGGDRAASLFRRGVTLPSGSALSDTEVERVVDTFVTCWSGSR